MVAALWANSNYDDDKGTRQGAIEQLETSFTNALTTILDGTTEEDQIDKTNPFFAQMEKGMEKLHGRVVQGSTVEKVIEQEGSDSSKEEDDFLKDIDQS